MKKRKIIIAVTGASGSIYAKLLFDKLLKLNNSNKSYVNDVTEIMGGLGSESDKLEKIGIKKKEREDFY